MSNASNCYQWWRKLFIEVVWPSAWCEVNHFKEGVPRAWWWKFLNRIISKSCIFTHLLVRNGWACTYPAPGFLHLWLLSSCEISSRSPWFAKRVVTNFSDVLTRNFCLHSQRPHAFFSDGCVTMLSVSQGCKLSDFAVTLWLRHNGTEIQRSQCMLYDSDFQQVFRGKLVFRERSSGVPQEIW